MATALSLTPPSRVQQRRRRVIDEAVDHAVDVMTERGVGALSVSEVARRMGMRPPSLYKYFPSLHAFYDALFARGLELLDRAIADAVDGADPGLPWLRAAAVAAVRWAVENPALAQLEFWRPVPAFVPSPETFSRSQQQMARLREQLRAAIERRELSAAADGDESVRLLTVLVSGLITQQLANEPGAAFEAGTFSGLTERALQLWYDAYKPGRTGHADAR